MLELSLRFPASPSVQEGFARAKRAQDDLDVQPNRPVVDVVEVVLDAPSQRLVRPDLAAMAVDLSPTCDARFDVVPPRVERNLPGPGLIVGERMRPRPDEGHLSAQHIQKLRQLIDVPT